MKIDTTDILLLEYLWRKPYYDLSIFNRPDFLQAERFPYHELDTKELVERLMRFIKHGLLMLAYHQSFFSIERVLLTPQHIERYFCDHRNGYESPEKWRSDPDERIIYIRLSRKGGQIWAEGVQADWSRYFVIHPGYRDRGSACLEATSKTTVKDALRMYQEEGVVNPHKPQILNIMRPWNPFEVYWLEFEEGFHLRFFVTDFDQTLEIPLKKNWRWRLVWRRDEQDRLILV